MYFIQPPPGVQWDKPYSHVQKAVISTPGQKATITLNIDNDQGIWVRRHKLSAFYVSGGNLARVVPAVVAQDRLEISIRRGNGTLNMDNPMDVLDWNDIPNDFLFPGWTLSPATVLTIEVSHQFVGVPNYGVPIYLIFSLSGYHIARGVG